MLTILLSGMVQAQVPVVHVEPTNGIRFEVPESNGGSTTLIIGEPIAETFTILDYQFLQPLYPIAAQAADVLLYSGEGIESRYANGIFHLIAPEGSFDILSSPLWDTAFFHGWGIRLELHGSSIRGIVLGTSNIPGKDDLRIAINSEIDSEAMSVLSGYTRPRTYEGHIQVYQN